MFLGSDGKYHLRLHGCAGQKIVVPQPLSAVLARRCEECGTAQEYEAAQQGRAGDGWKAIENIDAEVIGWIIESNWESKGRRA